MKMLTFSRDSYNNDQNDARGAYSHKVTIQSVLSSLISGAKRKPLANPFKTRYIKDYRDVPNHIKAQGIIVMKFNARINQYKTLMNLFRLQLWNLDHWTQDKTIDILSIDFREILLIAFALLPINCDQYLSLSRSAIANVLNTKVNRTVRYSHIKNIKLDFFNRLNRFRFWLRHYNISYDREDQSNDNASRNKTSNLTVRMFLSSLLLSLKSLLKLYGSKFYPGAQH
jgi:hypothetical protein